MNTLEAIGARASYRGNYLVTPVPREDLRAILEAGLAAPSGCNKQTTSLIAVDDPELLKPISALVHLPFVSTAPAMICVLTQRIIAYRDRCYQVQDYSAAIENMLLAAIELGYETCWLEGQVTDEDRIGRRIGDLLGVPEEYDLVCVLPIGRAADEVKHIKRTPFEERAWLNGFRKVF